MITLIALSRLIPMKGNYRIRKKHGRDISRGDGARLSFPVETSEPELESRAMKNKQTETKSRSGFGLTRHLIGGVLCLAVISLICSSASAQNLFAVDAVQGNYGNIDEFTPNGVRSVFASGLTSPFAMAFDSGGNLFVADGGNENAGSGAVYKFTPAGVRTTFALGLSNPAGLAFDSAGNLFVAEFGEINGGPGTGRIYKFTPNGVRTTFASGLFEPQGLAFDRAGNLFVAAGGTVSKFTPTGVHTAFASGLTSPFALAFDSRGNLFVADGGDPWDYPPVPGGVYKFTPTGLRSTIFSDMSGGLAIDSADNLFVGLAGSILKISPSGVRTTFASRSVGAMAFQRNLAPTATTLGNISTRAFVQTGENVMIGGFIVQGTGTKSVIIRAIGPELGLPPYNIPNALANPTLELHNAAGELLGSNDNWQTTIIGGIITSNQVSDIQNSGHAPTEASESAIIANLAPGNYTAIVRGVSNTTGVALVEAYDLSPGTTSTLGNISTRSFVQTGDNVMIGGFIVQGTGTKSVIIRAIGPELGLPPYNIPNALANPTLELHNAAGELLGSNDNWQTTIIGGIITSNQVSDIQNSGHAPTEASESAIIANLAPGNYTAIVRGVSNTTGVALVEVYDLNP